MKITLPQLLGFAVLASGASAQLHFDAKVYGPERPVEVLTDSITINPSATSQWSAADSVTDPWAAAWEITLSDEAAAVAPFTVSAEEGTSSTVAPMADAPPTFVHWDDSASWTTADRWTNPVAHGPMTEQNRMHEQQFQWPQDGSSGYEAISRLQPYQNITVVPETSTLVGAGVLLAFVTAHFMLHRRKRRRK
ncbi:MAG: hypothetical protein JJU00_04240 [Opitutales bacterium]|nr:hypothetical protein [Opitutales bacterium]